MRKSLFAQTCFNKYHKLGSELSSAWVSRTLNLDFFVEHASMLAGAHCGSSFLQDWGGGWLAMVGLGFGV